jgi:hypothetical protein
MPKKPDIAQIVDTALNQYPPVTGCIALPVTSPLLFNFKTIALTGVFFEPAQRLIFFLQARLITARL